MVGVLVLHIITRLVSLNLFICDVKKKNLITIILRRKNTLLGNKSCGPTS